MEMLKKMRGLRRNIHSMEMLQAREARKIAEVGEQILSLKDQIKGVNDLRLKKKLNRKLKIARAKVAKIRRRLNEAIHRENCLYDRLNNTVRQIIRPGRVKVASMKDVQSVVWLKKVRGFSGGIELFGKIKRVTLEKMINAAENANIHWI